jgi:hypothetical protein
MLKIRSMPRHFAKKSMPAAFEGIDFFDFGSMSLFA